MNTEVTENKVYFWKALLSFLLVLFLMPMGHSLMILMEHFIKPEVLPYTSFSLGFVGYVIVIIGVFVKGETKKTLYGLIGGLLFWTGWVEFILQYYSHRYGVIPDIVNGEIVTKPEYLMMPSSFGFLMMFMLMYTFSAKSGCDFFNGLQRIFFRDKRKKIVSQAMTRHTSIITFMELNMLMWSNYLLLLFCYDERFIGEKSPITFLVGLACFVGSIFMFKAQTKISSWDHNIRYSIATVTIFWNCVEILGRLNIIKEFWVKPLDHIWEMTAILVAFIGLFYFLFAGTSRLKRKKKLPNKSI